MILFPFFRNNSRVIYEMFFPCAIKLKRVTFRLRLSGFGNGYFSHFLS